MRFLFFIHIYLLSTSALAMHVVVDPGHGGSDRGATKAGVTESEITLSVAKMLESRLQRDPRFKVTMTRQSDIFLSLTERADLANSSGDVFVSIHANSSSDDKIHGHEIYFQNHLAPDEESLFLASRENQEHSSKKEMPRSVKMAGVRLKGLNPEVVAIVEDLERSHRIKMSGVFAEHLFHKWKGNRSKRSRTIRQAPFFVISNVNKPAALIEIGFISNPEEANKLASPDYQNTVAESIYNALISFKEYMDKPTVKSLN